jgi:hypothetical protein
MQGTFDLLDEFSDVVQSETRAQPSEVARLYVERLPWRGAPGCRETAPQRLVHHIAKCPPRSSHKRLEPRRDIFVEGQGRSPILMLTMAHRDIKVVANAQRRPRSIADQLVASQIRQLRTQLQR